MRKCKVFTLRRTLLALCLTTVDSFLPSRTSLQVSSTVLLFPGWNANFAKESQSSLKVKRHPTEAEEESRNLSETQPFTIQDPGLLASDLFAIAIASQLMGLLDIINDPEFIRNGGWLQPIPAVPSTLNTLIERISLLSLLWFPAAVLSSDSFSIESTTTTEHALFKSSLRSMAYFSGFRFFFALAASLLLGDQLGVLDALRDCYFVALSTTSFRFLYGRYVG